MNVCVYGDACESLLNVGDKFEKHEFLITPSCDCGLLGGDLIAGVGNVSWWCGE